MSTAKPAVLAAKPHAAAQAPSTAEKDTRQPVSKMSVSALREALDKLDVEIKEQVNLALEQMAPGTPFDPGLVRTVARIEARKHRLLVARFGALLKKGHPEIKGVVESLLCIEV